LAPLASAAAPGIGVGRRERGECVADSSLGGRFCVCACACRGGGQGAPRGLGEREARGKRVKRSHFFPPQNKKDSPPPVVCLCLVCKIVRDERFH